MPFDFSPTNDEVLVALSRGLAFFAGDGEWCKGDVCDEAGARCALGATLNVTLEEIYASLEPDSEESFIEVNDWLERVDGRVVGCLVGAMSFSDKRRALRKYAGEGKKFGWKTAPRVLIREAAQRVRDNPEHLVVSFNDADETVFEEVVALFERAVTARALALA